MTKGAQTAVLLTVILFAVYVYGRCEYARGAAESRLDARGDSLATESAETDSLYTRSVLQYTDSVRKLEQSTLAARREVARLKEVISAESRETAMPPNGGPDTTGALAASDPRDSLIAAQDSLIEALGGELALWKAYAQASDTVNARLTRERESYRGLAQDWERRAKPGLLTKVARGLPWAAAGFVAGVIVWEAAR